MGFFFNSSVIFCAKEQQEGDMWAPFHKNNFYRHKNIRENSKASTGRRDLEDLLSEFEDEDTSPYSDFFLSEPKTERLGYENIIIDDLEIGHSSIQGK